MSHIILGAGLAGLSAGLTLLEQGKKPLIIEGAPSFSTKGCGEFLSHDALPLLSRWGITPTRAIERIALYYNEREIDLPLPKPCASMPRLDLENRLLNLYQKKGGEIHFNQKVAFPYKTSGPLYISMGRWQGKKPSASPPFHGIKNHYHLPNFHSTLHMFFFSNGYVGVSPLDHEKVVVSCLSNKRFTTLEPIIDQIPQLQTLLSSANPLLSPIYTPVGHFGKKKLPQLPHTYFIGDAAGTVAPLSGGGMAMAITSGNLAATLSWKEYRHTWNRRYLPRILTSSLLNKLAFSPPLFSHLFQSLYFEKTFPFLFQITRDK